MILMFIMVIKSWITLPKMAVCGSPGTFCLAFTRSRWHWEGRPWFPPDEDGVTKALGFEGLAQVEVDILRDINHY